jgi:type I restriction enzyme S subunit
MAVWSETTFREVSDSTRIDADYYEPKYLKVSNTLSWGTPLKEYVRSLIHPAEFARRYSSEGWRVIRTQNVRPLSMDYDSNEVFLNGEMASRIIKNHLYDEDILITRTGANFGQCSIFYSNSIPSIATSHTFILRTNSRIDSAYLALFLNTRHGMLLIERGMYGSSQPEIAPKYLLRIPVPRFSNSIETDLASNVRSAYALRHEASVIYSQAQKILESELGLDKLRFDKPVDYTARFSITGLADILDAGRIDAQCFAPEAVFYENWLLRHTKCEHLFSLLSGTAKGCQQVEIEGGTTDYCSIKHISSHEIIGASKANPASGTPSAMKNDILLAITGATIGKIGIVNRYNELVFSGDLLRLRTNSNISPYYLLLVLHHHLGQVQFNRWVTGSTNGHLAPRDVGRVLVPRLSPGSEERISALVAKSLEKQLESEQLLEQAKSRVEQLIEEGVK